MSQGKKNLELIQTWAFRLQSENPATDIVIQQHPNVLPYISRLNLNVDTCLQHFMNELYIALTKKRN